MLAIVTVSVIFGLFLTFGVAIQLFNAAFGIWFTEVFIFFGVAWVMVRFSGRDPVRYAGLSAVGWRPALFGFALGAVNFFAVVVPIQFAAQSIAPKWLRDQFDISHLLRNQTPFELAAMIAGVGIAAPLCEEFVFRGVLQQGLISGPSDARKAIAWTAVIFSAAHLDPVGFAARLELGILFGILFWRTGSIWPSAMAHAANNLVSTAIYFALNDASTQSETPRDWWAVLTFAAIGNALLAWLISIARTHPEIFKTCRERNSAEVPRTSRSLFSLAWPWIAAAVASLLLFALAHPRGAVLSLYDMKYPLPPGASSSSSEARAAREDLQRLRIDARSGRISIEEYVKRRKELSESLRKRPPAASSEKPVPPD
ncbi:MAG TPA: type II CAAX endopeptidase family protein [Myxococcaceae bacterium]|nr:type II CAAX endopeptidase family protein [Myxococcaceae bacterium]